jgi:hypothetical protein
MKTLLIIAVLAVLTGCATPPVPTEVKIPVPVACKSVEPTQPTYRFSPPYSTLFDGTRDLMGDREMALAYELELRAALKSCK